MNFSSIFTNIDSEIFFLGKNLSVIKKDLSDNVGIVQSLFYKNQWGISQSDYNSVLRYFELYNSGSNSVQAWNGSMKNASKEAKTLVTEIAKGNTSLEEFSAAANTSQASAIAASIGMAALNAGITILASVAIRAAITGISNLIHAQERLHESVQKTLQDYKDQNDKLVKGQSDFDQLAKRYGELSKGVNTLGENVSLTTDEYDEYKSVVDQISEINPSLISGFNNQGDAILGVKGNVDKLIDSYREMMDASYDIILKDSGNLFKDFRNSVETANGTNYQFLSDPYKQFNNFGAEALEAILNSDDLDSAINEYAQKGWLATGQIVNKLKSSGFSKGMFESDQDYIRRVIQENHQSVQSIVDSYKRDLEESADGVAEYAQAYVGKAMLHGYSNISSSLKSTIQATIGELDYEFYSQFSSQAELNEYLDGLLEQFDSIGGRGEDAISLVFNMQTKFNNKECTIGDVISSINNLRGIISEFESEEDQKRILLSLGIDDKNGIEDQYNGIIDSYTEHLNGINFAEGNREKSLDNFKNWLNSLSSDEFQIAVGISLDEKSKDYTLSQWTQAVDNEVVNRKVTEENADYAKSLNGISKAAEDLAAGYDALSKAQSDMQSGEGVTAETIKALQKYLGDNEDVSDYLFSDENGKLQLNVDLWKERANAMTYKDMGALEDQIGNLQKQNAELEAQKINYDAIADEMNKIFGVGNVDLANRPVISPEVMRSSGWKDFDGSYATLFSSTFSAGNGAKYDYQYDQDVVIDITPILSNGEVLSPQALEEYVQDLIESDMDLLEADKIENGGLGLVLRVGDIENGDIDGAINKAEEWTTKLHDMQAVFYAIAGNNVEIDSIQKVLDVYQAIFDAQTKVVGSDPVDLKKLFSDIGNVRSEAEDIISALDKLKEGTKLTYDELYALSEKHPDLLNIENFMQLDTVEDQTAALEQASTKYEDRFQALIDAQLTILNSAKAELEAAGESTDVINGIIDNLNDFKDNGFVGMFSSNATTSLDSLISKATETANLISSIQSEITADSKNSFATLSSLMSAFGERWQEFVVYAEDGNSFSINIDKIKEEMYSLVDSAEGVAPQFKQAIKSMLDVEVEEKTFQEQVDKYIEDITALSEALQSIKSGDFTASDMYSLIAKFPTLARNTKHLDKAIVSLMKSMDSDIMTKFDIRISDVNTDAQRDQLLGLLDTVKQVRDEIGDSSGFQSEFDQLSQSMDDLATAIDESTSSAGLSADSVKKLTDRYKELKNFKPEELFEKTEQGIHLNTDKLRELEEEYEKFTKKKYQDELDKLVTKYNNLSVKIDHCSDVSKKAELYAQRSDVKEQIDDLTLLIAQYDGLTSALSKYERAKSSKDQGYGYDLIAGDKDTFKQLNDDGKFGKDDWYTYAEFMTGENTRGKSAQELYKIGKKALKKANRYFTVDDEETGSSEQNGVINFFEDLVKKSQKKGTNWGTKDSSGQYHLNIDSDNYKDVAKSFGMSWAAIEAILRKAEEYSFEINFDGLYDGLELSKIKAEEAADKLKELGVSKFNWDFNTTDITEIDKQIQVAQAALDKFKKSDGSIDINAPGAQDAITVLDTLTQLREGLTSNPTILDVDTSKLDKDVGRGIELLKQYKQASEGFDTAEQRQKVADLEEQINNLPTDVKLQLGLGGEVTPDSIKSAIENLNPEVVAKLDPSINSEVDTVRSDLEKPIIMTVDTSKSDADVGKAIELLKQFNQVSESVDTKEAKEKINDLTTQIDALPDDIKVKLGLTGEVTPKSIKESIENLTPKMLVELDPSLVDQFKKEDHDADGTVTWDNDTLKVTKYAAENKKATGIVTWYNNDVNVHQHFDATGTVHWQNANVNGTAHAMGTAFKSGSWGTKDSGVALGGELGTELVVRDGKFFTIGDVGAEFFRYKRGDIIFNAAQTKEIFEKGKITAAKSRGEVFADGNAFVSGSGTFMRKGKVVNKPTKTTKKSSSNSNSSNSNNDSNYNNNNDEIEDTNEKFDLIEVLIERVEQVINKFARIAESAFKSLGDRLSASVGEIDAVRQEIYDQSAGYDRYMWEANSIALPESMKQQIRDGAIDIVWYDEETRKLIEEYKEWYDKALACADAVDELNESLSELYKQRFDTIKGDYDNQIAMLEHQTTSYQNALNLIEEKGYLGGKSIYSRMLEVEQNNMDTLYREYESLTYAMNDAISAGNITEGSEAWYEMAEQINSVKQAIQESEIAAVKYNNAIREMDWSSFDYLQDTISAISDESDFLIKLMDSSKLFDDNGRFTNTGLSQMGLTAMNYDVYMSQADQYAKAVKRLNSELYSDPYNTKLIQRRNELLALQRKSIESAEEEKRAVADLVQNGINLELESLKELIDTYNESLDSAKDLYEYQKKVAEQSKNIASIEKQISAYQNDTSEENRARLQKLKTDLSSAVETLQDEQYDKYITDQKKLLDDLYEDYEETLNMRLDDIDALMDEMIDVANDNSHLISNTISQESAAVGYLLTENMSNIWKGMDDSLSHYGDNALIGVARVNVILSDIAKSVSMIVENGDSNSHMSNSSMSNYIYGFASGGRVSDAKKILRRNGDDYITVNTLKKGETVLTPPQARQFDSLVANLPQLQGLVNTSQYMNSIRSINSNSSSIPGIGGNIGQIQYDTDIHLEGITDYEEFISRMKSDDKFEKMLLDMTVNRLNGQSKLSKKKYTW